MYFFYLIKGIFIIKNNLQYSHSHTCIHTFIYIYIYIYACIYSHIISIYTCTIARKKMLPPKGICLPISKLHSILAVANLLAHNNISQICYCGQISLQSAAFNCSFSDNLITLGVTFIDSSICFWLFLDSSSFFTSMRDIKSKVMV